ncbi:MAG TPA: DUF3089 domain-containing protein [Sphingomicrobium sp.]|nr:DUF3089 domain-containing protein [Sphingomicrobium sp.]
MAVTGKGWRPWIPAFAGMTFALAAPAAAQSSRTPAPTAAPSAIDYRNAANWLCLPGRGDVCSTPLATTALNVTGYGSVGRSIVADNPPIDCFYVYPTVSRDAGLNSDMTAGPDERAAAETQFARFASVCRPFAPIYRQMTVASIAAFAAGADITQAATLAYSDVLAAWRDYIRNRNQGRPYVLIGHSQGSLHLIQLLAREIEGKPEAARMRLAILPGFNVLVPQGRLVGGSFRHTPLCSAPGQTGCVMSWVSYRDGNVPPPGAMFGFAPQPGMTVACVNPARPGSTGWEELDSYWYTRSSQPVPGGPIRWSSEGPPPTPYVRTPGLASGRCVNDGPRGYLSVRTNVAPGSLRTSRIGGEVGMLGFFLPGWGMHLADIGVAQGDLIRHVEEAGRK